jgi:hypothetical protein
LNGPRILELAARPTPVLFGEDEWPTLLDAEINSLADDVRHPNG